MMSTGAIFRWAGSKRLLIPELKKFWQGNNRYIEPFAGSAQLFFSINPKKAILSDTNAELINAYKKIKSMPSIIFDAYDKIPVSKDEYYKLRSLSPIELNDFDRAVRFVYLNRHCFNGLYRTNKKGEFNVPFGRGNGSGKLGKDVFMQCSKRLQNVNLKCEDFESLLLKEAKQGDFVYMDPPYALINKRIFTQYNSHSFGIDDLDRVSKLLSILDSKDVKFVLSYALSDEIAGMFNKWNTRTIRVQRNIAGFSKHRRIESELIITNTECQ